jgi:hypothetical protein
MTGAAAQHLTGVQLSGGFRIESLPDELTVTRDAWLSFSSLRSRWAYFLLLSFWLLVLAVSAGRFFYIGIALGFVTGFLRYMFAEVHNLHCTRDSLDVIDVVRGRQKRTRSFPRTEVKNISYRALNYPMGAQHATLVVTLATQRIEALYRLKCVEAQQILYEIQRLGYDVEHDVAMPMMVEMEQSRRKSWFCN